MAFGVKNGGIGYDQTCKDREFPKLFDPNQSQELLILG